VAKKNNRQIEEILNEFNFKRVHSVMKRLNWKWLLPTGEHRVPTPEELRVEAEKRLKRVASGKTTASGSGGLMAERLMDGVLELRFELEVAYGIG
jgi:hypothetical protein